MYLIHIPNFVADINRSIKDDQGSESRDIFLNLKLEPELRRSGGKHGRRFEALFYYNIHVSIYF